MLFMAIFFGAIIGLIFYGSNVTSYKKAGAGQIYRFEASTDLSVTGRSDVRSGTRSRVDHGFYSGSVSAAGRSQAYRMPGSIKNTIQQVQKIANTSGARPHSEHPPGHREQGGPRGSGRR